MFIFFEDTQRADASLRYGCSTRISIDNCKSDKRRQSADAYLLQRSRTQNLKLVQNDRQRVRPFSGDYDERIAQRLNVV
jgi:hypothetical protein